MSNSPLVTYTRISPHSNPRNHKIDTITIHCFVGQVTAKQGCDIDRFALDDADNDDASCNYVVGRDGSIGLCTDESRRSWCTSNRENDHRAITIEVASDSFHPYAVTAEAYAALLDLLTDICRRNGIPQLLWKADKSLIGQVDKQNMTVHRWFANKACPGDYLYNKHGEIAAEVNRRLGAIPPKEDAPADKEEAPVTVAIQAGTALTLSDTLVYKSSTAKTAAKTMTGTYWVWGEKTYSGRIKITNRKDRVGTAGQVSGWLDLDVAKGLVSGSAETVQPEAPPEKEEAQAFPYLVKTVTVPLNVRKGPGTDTAITTTIRSKGIYTIVDAQDGWGKLKSGAGWIKLSYTEKL